MSTLRIQSILFHNEPCAIERTLHNLHRAADLAIAQGSFSSVQVVYGDCSPDRLFDDADLGRLRGVHEGYLSLAYKHFGQNLGSAKGHNSLLAESDADYVLIMNPDVVVAPNTLIELKKPLVQPDVGMVEARQLPVEHPKAYDETTGETGWATTACALFPSTVLAQVGHFDDETFFLYCDDVDLSWRIRLAGFKVIYQPVAVVFHDKRLSTSGAWMPSNAERYYSAEAALLLAYKWSRADLADEILRKFKASDSDHLMKAAQVFEERRAQGRLPQQLDANHQVAEFIGDHYTRHRFAL